MLKKMLLVMALAYSMLSSLSAAETPPKKPNIIFILVDDLGYGDVGVLHQNERKKAGLPAIDTPHLDKLAADGMILSRHYCAAPVCAPSRASLFTGVHQGNARVVRNNTFDMPLENSHTIAGVLKHAGYATALIGKWGLAGGRESGGSPTESPAYPTKRGFDYFFGYLDHISGHNHYPKGEGLKKNKNNLWDQNTVITENADMCYSTDLFTARAKKWIVDTQKNSPTQPFFLALTLIAPHSVLSVPRMAYPDGGGLNGGVQWTGTPHQLINTAVGDAPADKYFYPQYAEQKWGEYPKRHATMVTRIDDAVGDLRMLLTDLGISENTLVVFTSDNGPHNEGGQDPAFFASYQKMDGVKRDTWEAGCRVPTLAVWEKNIAGNSICNEPSQFHDWLATFAELAGLPIPARTDGVSLVPLLKQNGQRDGGNVYIEYYYPGKTPAYKNFAPHHANAIREQEQIIYVDGYKGIRTGVKSASDDFIIYDTLNDPQELKNLAVAENLADKNDAEKFNAIQAKMKDRVLQIRRIYEYQNNVRGNMARRPYDVAAVPAIAPIANNPSIENPLYKQMILSITPTAALWAVQIPEAQISETVFPLAGSGDINFDFPENTPPEFTAQISGWLEITEDGAYDFTLTLDGNQTSKAFMRLHDMQLIDGEAHIFLTDDSAGGADLAMRIYDQSTTINCDEMKPPKPDAQNTNPNAAVPLKAGKHPIRISYVHGKGNAKPLLNLQVSKRK